ncbi:MAG: sugar phosphate isomerase/epimerase [Clostridia bacterium]|nr:sugar phosphate isomerase/epimerase [Clostridia bacterium]
MEKTSDSGFPFCFWVFKQDIWSPEVRRALKEAGIAEISIEPSAFMPEKYTRDDVRRLRAILDEDGLSVSTAHPPFGSFNQRFSLLRQSPTGLIEDLAYMKEFILRCAILGVKAIPLHTGGAMLPDSRPWEIACAHRYVEALMPTAQEHGVVIAIENTNHATAVGFYEGLEEDVPLNLNIWKFDDTDRILDFVRSFHSPFVKVCYDTGHSHLLGKMLEDYEAFRDEIVLLHLHDNDGAGSDAHLQPGYGNSDWKTLFENIKRMKRTPILFVEAQPRYDDLRLFVREMQALWENRVKIKKGDFLEKDENTAHLSLPEEKKPC